MREEISGVEVDEGVKGRDADNFLGLGFRRPAGSRLKKPAGAVMIKLPFAHISRPGEKGMGK